MSNPVSKKQWNERRSLRRQNPRARDFRPLYEKDRPRIIHCAAFRGLAGKTQVLGVPEGDFHRTRLTHSMEVAQIGRGIVLQLLGDKSIDTSVRGVLPPVPVIESVCYAHDLGHPPFGHRGELALDYLMRNFGGFEANAQTLRILARDELHTQHDGVRFGLDPTRRVLLGVLKYPAARCNLQPIRPQRAPKSIRNLNLDNWKITKCFYDDDQDVVDFITLHFSDQDKELLAKSTPKNGVSMPQRTDHKSLDASIMDIADEIAYAVHDLEDAVAYGLISRDYWSRVEPLLSKWKAYFDTEFEKSRIDSVGTGLFCEPGDEHNRKLSVGTLITGMVELVEITELPEFEEPVLRYRARLKDEAAAVREAISDLVEDHVIRSQTVQTVEYGGQQIVGSVLEAILSDPRNLLKATFQKSVDWESKAAVARAVCSYVAGMTDNYASRLYERLFLPRHGSVFERL